MPDGSRVSGACMLPPALVAVAERTFGVSWPHVGIVASVNWLMFLRGDANADPVAVAQHYALWCFDERYYAAYIRLRALVQVQG